MGPRVALIGGMSAFPIDRLRPPGRVVHRGGGRHIELRPYTFADVDRLAAAIERSRAELKGFMPWSHAPSTREGDYDLIARFQSNYWSGREYVCGVFSEAGELLGGCGLHPRTALNPAALEVGYWCHSEHAGRGYTTLAVKMLAVLAFDRFACDRLQVMHDEANVASQRVVEKCGFVYEGTMRNATAAVTPELRAGGYLGTAKHRLYGITPEDFARFGWVGEVRAAMTYVDALGRVVSAALTA